MISTARPDPTESLGKPFNIEPENLRNIHTSSETAKNWGSQPFSRIPDDPAQNSQETQSAVRLQLAPDAPALRSSPLIHVYFHPHRDRPARSLATARCADSLDCLTEHQLQSVARKNHAEGGSVHRARPPVRVVQIRERGEKLELESGSLLLIDSFFTIFSTNSLTTDLQRMLSVCPVIT